jgi:hypothetical protein
VPIYVDCPERRRLRDISLTGAFVEDKHPLPAGRRVQLRFWLSTVEPVVIDSVIRRVEEGRGVAAEFLTMTEADHNQLREFLTLALYWGV